MKRQVEPNVNPAACSRILFAKGALGAGAEVSAGSVPRKSLGQNFIHDVDLLDKLAELSGVTAEECVLEIGAGLGGMTAALAQRARHVLALEIDHSLEPALTELSLRHGNVTVCIADATRADWVALIGEHLPGDAPVRFVSNLPYYITTPLLTRAFQFAPVFAGIACMVQSEVADKLEALPGGGGYGPLAIWAQSIYVPRVALEVPRGAFSPPPNVDSSFVLCKRRVDPIVSPDEYERFAKIIDAAFGMRRKTLRNNFRAAFAMPAEAVEQWLIGADVDPQARAETLSAEDFARIMRHYEQRGKAMQQGMAHL